MATHDYKITVKANDRQPVSGPVNFIRLHASTGNLKIDIDGKVTELAVGQAIVLDELIDLFHVVNETGSDIAATFKLGAGAQITDNNLSGTVSISKATTFTPTADVNVPGTGARVLLKAANANRRSVTVKNLNANTETIRIGDVTCTAAMGAELGPGESYTYEGTAAVYGIQLGASGVPCNVCIVETLD